ASEDNPELLQKIFTSKLNFAPDDPNGKINFVNLMVQREFARTSGEASLEAFARDIQRLKGSLGSGDFKAALVDVDIALQYAQGIDHVNGLASGNFEARVNPVAGGIQFEHKAEDDQWVADSFKSLDTTLRGKFAGLTDAGFGGAERYTLQSEGNLVV